MSLCGRERGVASVMMVKAVTGEMIDDKSKDKKENAGTG
jgi:hypothetical protein